MDRSTLAAHKLGNAIQSLLLVGTLALLLGLLAWILGGPPFVMLALAGVAFLYLANPVASPRLVMSLYRGRLVTPREAPDLYELIVELARRAELPRVPRLYYLPSRVMNAFATGTREDSSVAVSDGLLRGLTMRELAGVLAHEVSHIANGDLQVMAFADTVSRIAGVLSLAGQLLLLLSLPMIAVGGAEVPWVAILALLLAPSLSALVQLALSRNREYDADLGAAELTGDPAGLALALDKLERVGGRFWEQILLPGRRVPEPSLLRTHPDTRERVDRLMELVPRGTARRAAPQVLGEYPVGMPGAGGWGVPMRPRRHLLGLWY
jgi:heat shock protein HtpX